MRIVFWAFLLPLSSAVTSAGCGDAATSQTPVRSNTTTTPAETVNDTKGEPSSSTAAKPLSREHGGPVVETKSPPNGCVFGRLTYQADSTRPWRYGRYYVNRKSGELAGAIVCLSSRSLRKYDPDEDEPKTWTMDQKNYEFRPEVLAIRAGDEVRFLNSDTTSHNVHASGLYESFNAMTPVGDSLFRKFSHAGNERYPVGIHCDLHSQMRAWIYVFSHPFHQLTGPSGQFEFRGVPAGEYDLVAIHPAGQLRSRQKIRIVGGKKSSVEVVLSPDDLRRPAGEK